MKFDIYLSVFSIVAAVAYGVAFSYTYPLVQITEGLIVLSTVLGLATCLVVVATWKFIEKVTVSLSKLLQGDVPQDQGVSQTQLAGNERAKLREAILIGFSPDSLDEVLRDNDMFRPNIASGPDFFARVSSLIEVASQEGWLIDLCRVLASERAGNKAVSGAIIAVQRALVDGLHPVPKTPN